MVHLRISIAALLLGAACSGGSGRGSGSGAAADGCTTAVDKLFAMLTRARGWTPEPGRRDGAIADCRTRPDDPLFACLNAAPDDPAIHACMQPKGEAAEMLARAVEALRTYFFVNETFTDQKIPLTPAQPCCDFPNQRCPPDPAPDPILTEIVNLDFSDAHRFQYRYESTATKAVVEAVGDLDCDGVTVTYRREVEQRDDGNMHITVIDPRAGAD